MNPYNPLSKLVSSPDHSEPFPFPLFRFLYSGCLLGPGRSVQFPSRDGRTRNGRRASCTTCRLPNNCVKGPPRPMLVSRKSARTNERTNGGKAGCCSYCSTSYATTMCYQERPHDDTHPPPRSTHPPRLSSEEARPRRSPVFSRRAGVMTKRAATIARHMSPSRHDG